MKSRIKLDKLKRALLIHSIRRARTRYRKDFSHRDYHNICKLIDVGKSSRLRTLASKRTIERVCYGKMVYYAVFDRKLARVVTFLPYDDPIVDQWRTQLIEEGKRPKGWL